MSIEEVAKELDTEVMLLEMIRNLCGEKGLEQFIERRLKQLSKGGSHE